MKCWLAIAAAVENIIIRYSLSFTLCGRIHQHGHSGITKVREVFDIRVLILKRDEESIIRFKVKVQLGLLKDQTLTSCFL